MRYDGTEVLVDPGTYCYHGEPQWRSYFRSTLAHNTIELDGTSQSVEGGPFMWSDHASTRVLDASEEDPQYWTARHSGYAHLDPGARHQRTVCLDRATRHLSVDDVVKSEGRHALRLLLHLGPDVTVDLPPDPAESAARLTLARPRAARSPPGLHLPGGLSLDRAPRRDRPGPRLVLARASANGSRPRPWSERARSTGAWSCGRRSTSPGARRGTADEEPPCAVERLLVSRRSGLLQRLGWGVADQAVSSVANFALGIFVARSLGAGGVRCLQPRLPHLLLRAERRVGAWRPTR